MKTWGKAILGGVALLVCLMAGADAASSDQLANRWYMERVAHALEKAYVDGRMPKLEKLDDKCLLGLTSAPCMEVRGAAVYALGELKETRAVAPLIAMLSSGDTYCRRSAARALGKIGDPRAVEPLARLLVDRHQPLPVRFDAAEALGFFSDPLAKASLNNIGPDEHAWLQRIAHRALVRIQAAENSVTAKVNN